MAELERTVNLVVYMSGKTLEVNRKQFHYLGAHGYSYTLSNEGKKKLAKDVATTNGYYVNNNQKANTVVVVDDIISMTVPNANSLIQAVLLGFKTVLFKFVESGSVYKNLCLITPHKVLQEVYKITRATLKEKVSFGKMELTEADMKVLGEVVDVVDAFKALGESKIIFDFLGSTEGGLGNRLAFKQVEMAEVITTFSDDKDVELFVVPRKVYENPETDFNKLVTATRWYYDSLNTELFYDLTHGYRKYSFGKVEPDKNYYGKVTPDVTYSALYTKTPIALLDKLFEFTTRKVDNPNGYLVGGDLNHLCSKEVARLIDTHPAIREGNNLVSPVTKGNGKPILIELISPVLMSYRIRDEIAGLDVLLNSFKARDDQNKFGSTTFIDITDEFFIKTENKKGDIKVTLNPAFNTLKSVFKFTVEHPNAVKPVTLTLSVGYDMPDRNSFNSVTCPNAKVWLAADTRNSKGVRYCTLVETDDHIYIHTSAEANLKVLSLSELGRNKEKEKA